MQRSQGPEDHDPQEFKVTFGLRWTRGIKLIAVLTAIGAALALWEKIVPLLGIVPVAALTLTSASIPLFGHSPGVQSAFLPLCTTLGGFLI